MDRIRRTFDGERPEQAPLPRIKTINLRTFAYDLANRLKQTTLGNTTTTYAYDGDGKRLQASTGSQAAKKTNFLWDVNQGLPQIALERDGNNSLLRRYVYGTRRVSQTAGNNTSYYLHDGLGSVSNLTSSSGATQWTWSYEPFGSIRSEQKASGNQPDNLPKFAGEYLDPTGLYHLRARQYDPASGRFLTRDPVAGGIAEPYIGSYTYVGNRPTALIDPSGMKSRWIHLGIALWEVGDAVILFAAAGTIATICLTSDAISGGLAIAVTAIPCAVGTAGAAAGGVAASYAAYKSFREFLNPEEETPSSIQFSPRPAAYLNPGLGSNGK